MQLEILLCLRRSEQNKPKISMHFFIPTVFFCNMRLNNKRVSIFVFADNAAGVFYNTFKCNKIAFFLALFFAST